MADETTEYRLVLPGPAAARHDDRFVAPVPRPSVAINVATRLGQIPHGAEFDSRALYLLAAANTPEEARSEALRRAEEGERITSAAAKEEATWALGQVTAWMLA